jgi:hypothetical protein
MLEDADSNEQGKKQRQRYCPGVQAERKSAFLVFGGKISRLDSQGSILLSNKSFQLAWDTACLSASVGNSSCALSTRAQTRGQSAVVSLLHCWFLHFLIPARLSVHSRYGLHARQVVFATLCARGFSSLVASTAALIATGWSEPVPGRVHSHCGPAPFTAHKKCGLAVSIS